MNRFLQVGLLTSLLWAPAVLAASLPAYYPQTFQRIGQIGQLIKQKNHIVISDQVYKMSPSTLISTSWSRNARASNLRVGRHIGFSVTGEGGGQMGTVTHIWLIPKGIKPGQ